MRVIAGRLGGRLFASPSSERTHPMSDKIRGALFNTLGDIEGLTVLDPFTGSGALSFEAISRGASSVTALDIESLAIGSVELCLDQLGITAEVKAIRVSGASWLKTASADKLFDLVLCDPPYDDPQLELVIRLADRAKVNGLVVLSLPSDVYPKLPDYFKLVMTKSYGDARLYFYRRST